MIEIASMQRGIRQKLPPYHTYHCQTGGAPLPTCFAIMPITTPKDVLERYDGDTQHFIRVAKHIFKPAAEAIGYEFLAPSATNLEIIQAEIIRQLETADLVLCDISTFNPNVFFELGIRVALDRPVAMVKDNHTERIPFDNAMINTHTYNANMAVWSVEEEVPKLHNFLAAAKGQNQNALWKYFGITQRAKQSDPNNPEDAKFDLLLAEMTRLRSEFEDRYSVRAVDVPPSRHLEVLDEILLSAPEAGGQRLIPAAQERLSLSAPTEGALIRWFSQAGTVYVEVNKNATLQQKWNIGRVLADYFPEVRHVRFIDDSGAITYSMEEL